MDREKNIRAVVQPFIDDLYELYEETDPSKGCVSEKWKLERAQNAIHIWWRAYGYLLLWAQSQIVGYELVKEFPDWANQLDLTPDCHELELLGLSYAHNPPENQLAKDPPDGFDLTDDVLRRAIARLLLSTDANSSFWRFPLEHALRAANAGELASLCKPSMTRRRGQPYRLDYTKANAVAHVHYLIGKGIKKHIALERIADAVAQSPETLKDWEKGLRKDDYFAFMWESAHLAGQLEGVIKSNSLNDLVEEYGAELFGPTSDFVVACAFIKEKDDELSLERLKADLRKYHDRSSAGKGAD